MATNPIQSEETGSVELPKVSGQAEVSSEPAEEEPKKQRWDDFASTHPDARHLRNQRLTSEQQKSGPSAGGGSKMLEYVILVVSLIAFGVSAAGLVAANKNQDKLSHPKHTTAAAHAPAAAAAESHEWCWSGECGPKYWGTLNLPNDGDKACLGTYEQSPIDIPAAVEGFALTTTTVSNQKVKGLTTAGSSTTGNKFTVSQSHGAPKFSCKGVAGSCGHITINTKQYNLLQIHFHSPSEHTIDGKHYPLCAHMVHGHNDGTYAVLGIMFDQTAPSTSTSVPVQRINKLFNYMKDTSSEVSTATDMYDFVSANSGYYNYQGSFTTPPCTEGVNWLVQSEIIAITKAQVDFFWSHIGGYPGNSRPTMPLNGRTITYNVPANEVPGAWAWAPYDKFGLPTGPDAWTSLGYSACAGVKQSPIDFPVTAASKTATGKIGSVGAKVLITAVADTNDMMVKASAVYTVTQSHGAPKFTCKTAGTCGSIKVPAALSGGAFSSEETFNLLQVHFHSPSEHTIDGKIYPLAAHMVHVNTAGTLYAVVGVVFDTSEDDATTSNLVANAIDSILTTSTHLTSEGVDTSAFDFQSSFVSPSSGFYNYPGSFTTPPCTEAVTWIVQAEVQKIKPSQVKAFYDHIGGFPGNYRPPQPLGARTINYEVA